MEDFKDTLLTKEQIGKLIRIREGRSTIRDLMELDPSLTEAQAKQLLEEMRLQEAATKRKRIGVGLAIAVAAVLLGFYFRPLIIPTPDAPDSSPPVLTKTEPPPVKTVDVIDQAPKEESPPPAPSQPVVSKATQPIPWPELVSGDEFRKTTEKFSIAGVIYDNGVFQYDGAGWAIYDLGNRYTSFEAKVGMPDDWSDAGPVNKFDPTYRFLVDNRVVASGRIRQHEAAKRLKIALRSGGSLRIETQRRHAR